MKLMKMTLNEAEELLKKWHLLIEFALCSPATAATMNPKMKTVKVTPINPFIHMFFGT